MMLLEEEKTKVNSSEIRTLEPTLDRIAQEEQKLINEFEINAELYLGKELLEELKEDTGFKTFIEKPERKKEIQTSNGRYATNYAGLLTMFHKSMITNQALKNKYEQALQKFFKAKTDEFKKMLNGKTTYSEIEKYIPSIYALASLGITAFHKQSGISLYDVQKLAGIAISEGRIAELGTGEGKTLSGVLPTFLHALRGNGAHIITSNSYLSNRDYEELAPIFEGLGLTVGYVPESIEDMAFIHGLDYSKMNDKEKRELEKEWIKEKQKAYLCDITYGSKNAIAFDYLRDTTAKKKEELLQRTCKPGFALVDEVDDALVDDATCPYVLGKSFPTFRQGMKLRDLAAVLNVPYNELYERLYKLGIEININEILTYEKAQSIAMRTYQKEIAIDDTEYQRSANYFAKSLIDKGRVLIVDEKLAKTIGLTPEKLYEILTEKETGEVYVPNDKEATERINRRINELKAQAMVFVLPTQKDIYLKDEARDRFLYESFLIHKFKEVMNRDGRNILKDPKYIEGKDYIIKNDIIQVLEGAEIKILQDSNYQKVRLAYSKFLRHMDDDLLSVQVADALDNALYANLLMHKGDHYDIVDGKVKVLKNGRVVDGSTYSKGLHQAIELKEGLLHVTRRNQTVASISQKDFYSRYEAFSGMTGTSADEIFEDVYGISTAHIPKNAYYRRYSKHRSKTESSKEKELIGVEKKETKYLGTKEEKYQKILESIIESRKSIPPQPVLLVVSDPSKFEELSEFLSENGIVHGRINSSSSKENEALMIAQAGRKGRVTLVTEMAGRGTDIKLGGDRETIIDIYTARGIRNKEKELNRSLTTQEKSMIRTIVERKLMGLNPGSKKQILSKTEEQSERESLASTGLKIITNGFFKTGRVDRQLEGRTGRNGLAGVCERYASEEDFEYIGVKDMSLGVSISQFFKANLTENGFSQSATEKLNKRVEETQKQNEGHIKENIVYTQSLSRTSTKIMEGLRQKRRNILTKNISLDTEVQQLFEDTVDNLLISYIFEGNVESKRNLTEALSRGIIKINLEGLSLAVKETIGINLDVNSIREEDVNLLELRNALVNYLIENHLTKKKEKSVEQDEIDINMLLDANTIATSNVDNILSQAVTTKKISGVVPGIDDSEIDYNSIVEFNRGYEAVKMLASTEAVRGVYGVQLTKEEEKRLSEIKVALFDSKYDATRDQMAEPKSVEHDGLAVKRFREARRELEEKNAKEMKKISRKSKHKEAEDITKKYATLKIRPIALVKDVADGGLSLKMVDPLQVIRNSEQKKL